MIWRDFEIRSFVFQWSHCAILTGLYNLSKNIEVVKKFQYVIGYQLVKYSNKCRFSQTSLQKPQWGECSGNSVLARSFVGHQNIPYSAGESMQVWYRCPSKIKGNWHGRPVVPKSGFCVARHDWFELVLSQEGGIIFVFKFLTVMKIHSLYGHWIGTLWF